MGSDRRGLVGLIAVTLAVAGCIGESSLDFGTPVNMHVWSTPTSVEVDAPGWLTASSSVYLCYERPPRLPSDTASRQGWVPGPACQDFGVRASHDGLKASIPVSMLDPARRAAFDAADDWYLLLVAVEGERATGAITSRFHAPPDGAAS
jgi:hypothetical protein